MRLSAKQLDAISRIFIGLAVASAAGFAAGISGHTDMTKLEISFLGVGFFCFTIIAVTLLKES